MKKSRNTVKKSILVLFSLALVCLSSSVFAQGGKQITLSAEQYQILKQTIQAQDKTLDMLESSLSRQQSRQQERSRQLQQLNTQLDKSKAEMIKTRQTLQSAGESLAQADNLLKRQAVSLQTLTEQIKREEHKKTVIKRQRDMYAVLAILAVGGAVVK
nr:MAG TPA: Peptidoglycan endopeptidase [Caudoviricetes sp.]